MKKLASTSMTLALFALPVAAEGFSWNGSYEGHFVCDDVTAGAAGGFSRPFEVQIIQNGSDIDLAISAVVDPAAGASSSRYRIQTGRATLWVLPNPCCSTRGA